MPDPLRVAVLAMTAGDDPAANGAIIADALARATAAGARALLTPECCLTGYPGAARADLAALDACRIAELEDALALDAESRGILLVLGTASPDGEGGWTDDAFACGAIAPQRHRKRALTPGDTAHFVAGAKPTVVDFVGWRLGLAVCYEVRFPALWPEADAFLAVAHMAGADPDPGTKAAVVPALFAARAAEWAAPLALANTAAGDRWLDSAVWDARGVRTASAGEGLLVADLVHRDALPPWYGELHRAQRRFRSS